MLYLVCLLSILPTLTDQELIDIRDGFEGRRDEALQIQVENPYPGAGDGKDLKLYGWNKFTYALAAMFLNKGVEKANEAIIDAVDRLLASDALIGEMGFHWLGNIVVRLYLMFGPDGTRKVNLLRCESAEAIRKVLWKWAKSESWLKSTKPEETWFIWGSENHEAMRDATAWGTLTDTA